ncbi:putative pyridine nucleotide-disulfide oxidoreductase RclA [Chryseobacterium aquaeductus]|uniref:Pyridine nucleotide-disulfide oxidoreductase RclA n=1 Tax=Chryseobacterium aquaeductus TaxID=2675056 RepID=A0A9N8MH20_9FLAO|nr:mercuric reductase [Chryseobacterium aquaeductus]CAA7331053.1 putative pyridine nucleotide-disulfide oxidoreductase RclA [Chryseobacterium potabilaquae]CAD7807895.1 putative pyridine nucleotide-disulfide oxidoreductase RclA [Chryseobacterium aquaeductus]
MIKKDAIIIGSGQAGNPLALKLSAAGLKTVLIEKSEEMLGGVCVNVGCTPSKTLIASAKAMHKIKTAHKHGISVPDVSIDFEITQKRKNDIVAKSKKGVKKNLEEAENLDLIYGTASFSGEKTISVQNESEEAIEFTAPYIFINVGCRPATPEIDGLKDVKWYDSTGILELQEIPKKLIVIGSGYIGLELGQMYSRFGSEVIIVEKAGQIISNEDADIAENLQEILEEEGLTFHLNSEIKNVKQDDNKITLTFTKNNKQEQIEGTHLLIVTGRKSNADSLHLEKAGIKQDDKGYIKVNQKLETNVDGVYALGDIKGGPQFTHISYNDYVIVSDNILEQKNTSTEGRIIPYTVFTDPQVGRVGLSEKEATEKNLNFTVIKIPGKRITRGLESAETQGLWKAVVDNDSDKILGAAIIGSEGGEMTSIIQMAMKGNISAKDLQTFIFSHPTYSESLNTLFDELE